MKSEELKPIHFMALIAWLNFFAFIWTFATETIKFDFKNIALALTILGIALVTSSEASPKIGK